MKNTERREKVEVLIYDLGSWLPRSNYKCILAFCDYELLQYGIDPKKGIDNLLQDGIDYYDLSDPPLLKYWLFDNKFNWTSHEEYRALMLLQLYKYCNGLKTHSWCTLDPKVTYDFGELETKIAMASWFAAEITYLLTLTLRDDLTLEEFNKVNARLEGFLEDRSRGGKGKAETEAKAIARKRARHFLAKNPRHTKPDLIEKITAEMLQDKDQYKLKREVPSFDTLSKWLVKLDID